MRVLEQRLHGPAGPLLGEVLARQRRAIGAVGQVPSMANGAMRGIGRFARFRLRGGEVRRRSVDDNRLRGGRLSRLSFRYLDRLDRGIRLAFVGEGQDGSRMVHHLRCAAADCFG